MLRLSLMPYDVIGTPVINEALATIGQRGPQPWAREVGYAHAPDDFPWCGIWVRAIWRRAKLKVPIWVVGSDNTHYLEKTSSPTAGDLVLLHTGHQGIYCYQIGHTVSTIDGNGYDFEREIDQNPNHIVCNHEWHVSEIAAYYSIRKLQT